MLCLLVTCTDLPSCKQRLARSTHHGTPRCGTKQRIVRVGVLLDHLVDHVGPARVRGDLQAGDASIRTRAQSCYSG